MSMLDRHFRNHPRSVGETYLEHMHTAGSIGGMMFVASMACFVHAIFPNLFVKTGSAAILHLHDKLIVNRARQASPAQSVPVDAR